MSENKPKYVLCPRCELNYIEESEGYCKVCKASLGLIDASVLMPDEDDMLTGEKLCPICKVNYIGEDEEICFLCKREREEKEHSEENDDAWREFVEDESPEEESDMGPLSLEGMADEEADEEDEGFDDPTSHDHDDFDFVTPDESDFDDFDEEDEDEEDADEGDEE